MHTRFLTICILIGFMLSACAVPDPAGMLWKAQSAGDTLFPGERTFYVKSTNVGTKNSGGLLCIDQNDGKILWEIRIVANKGSLTYVEAGQKKFAIQLEHYADDNMVDGNYKTNVVGYVEQSGVVLIKTDEERSDGVWFHRLYAIRLSDGQILWKVGLNSLQEKDLGYSFGDLFIKDSLISFVSAQKTWKDRIGNTIYYDLKMYLNIYDAVTGKIWTDFLDNQMGGDKSSFVVDQRIQYKDGKIYLSGGYPRMWDLRSGEKTETQTPASIVKQALNYTPVVVLKDRAGYFARFFPQGSIFKGDFSVTALNLETGETLWQYKQYREDTTDVTRGPLVTGNSVITTQGDMIFVLDIKTGSLVNQTKLPAQIDDIAVAQNHLYALSGGTLYAIDLDAARKK